MSSSVSAEFYWLAVAIVTIISSARLTRLATFDKFPPIQWARDKYADVTDGTGWQLVAFCGYCFSFWATTLVVLTAGACGVFEPSDEMGLPETAWWTVNSILAGSYLAAVFMAHDGDEGDD